MTYKYYYRIDLEHQNGCDPLERGSIICQCRNSRFDSKLMRIIRRAIDLEMSEFGSDSVYAYVYRLEGEFTKYTPLLDCTGGLKCIYAETRFNFTTKKLWFDASLKPFRSHTIWTDELPEEVRNSGRH